MFEAPKQTLPIQIRHILYSRRGTGKFQRASKMSMKHNLWSGSQLMKHL